MISPSPSDFRQYHLHSRIIAHNHRDGYPGIHQRAAAVDTAIFLQTIPFLRVKTAELKPEIRGISSHMRDHQIKQSPRLIAGYKLPRGETGIPCGLVRR